MRLRMRAIALGSVTGVVVLGGGLGVPRWVCGQLLPAAAPVVEGSATEAAAAVPVGVQKKSAPVFTGSDPNQIPRNETIITQIIPLHYVDGVRLRNDLTPLLSAEADVAANAASNTIIITDKAYQVRRMVEIISSMDRQAAEFTAAGPQRTRFSWAIPEAAVDGVVNVKGLLAAPMVEVRSPMDGTLEGRDVRDGVAVNRGEVLFQFERQMAAAELDLARARVEAARASGAGAGEQETLKAALAEAEAELRLKEMAVSALTVQSPAEGVLMTDMSGGQMVTRGMVMGRVIDTRRMNVEFAVQSRDAAGLRVGQPLAFKPAALPGAEFAGEVTMISPVVEHRVQTGAAGTVEVERVMVRGRIVENLERLKSGMGGAVVVHAGEKR